MDKKNIIRNFSRYAHTYDKYADVQRIAGLELLSWIEEDNFKKILEVGCGTGNYTVILREKFKNAEVKAVDISPKMIEVAQDKLKGNDVEFVVADAEEVNLDCGFDLITSNAALQWFNHLDETLIKYKDMLKRNGIISFSIFGPLTFWELDRSLKRVLKNVSLEADKFIPADKLEDMLHRNFTKVKVKETVFTRTHLNLKRLLEKIKYTGIRGNGLNGQVHFSRSFLKKLEEAYLAKFSQIKATYQIFFCQGTRK